MKRTHWIGGCLALALVLCPTLALATDTSTSTAKDSSRFLDLEALHFRALSNELFSQGLSSWKGVLSSRNQKDMTPNDYAQKLDTLYTQTWQIQMQALLQEPSLSQADSQAIQSWIEMSSSIVSETGERYSYIDSSYQALQSGVESNILAAEKENDWKIQRDGHALYISWHNEDAESGNKFFLANNGSFVEDILQENDDILQVYIAMWGRESIVIYQIDLMDASKTSEGASAEGTYLAINPTSILVAYDKSNDVSSLSDFANQLHDSNDFFSYNSKYYSLSGQQMKPTARQQNSIKTTEK